MAAKEPTVVRMVLAVANLDSEVVDIFWQCFCLFGWSLICIPHIKIVLFIKKRFQRRMKSKKEINSSSEKLERKLRLLTSIC